MVTGVVHKFRQRREIRQLEMELLTMERTSLLRKETPHEMNSSRQKMISGIVSSSVFRPTGDSGRGVQQTARGVEAESLKGRRGCD